MSTTVLTVDDSRAMRDMLRHSLAAAGFRVLQAEDGLHGLELLESEMPDVIVTDINMPRMDGFGFIEAVRRDAARQPYRRPPCRRNACSAPSARRLRPWSPPVRRAAR